MRDNEWSPPSFGEGVVADDTVRTLRNESTDTISNTVVIDEGDVVTVESSVNNTVTVEDNTRIVVIITAIIVIRIVM